MMDIKQIKELVALMKENDLTEVDLKTGTEAVTIKRGGSGAPIVHYAPPSPAASAPAPHANGSAPAPAPAAPPAGPQATLDSPMVGTVYLAPNPDAAPFAKIGQRVSKDTVVCLIEAMKVFNEIKAEKDGVIEQILVKNGEAVEFGQKLFALRPA
jgi:acetyl-CoA carboxylase biotin carboxyl carrier protein